MLIDPTDLAPAALVRVLGVAVAGLMLTACTSQPRMKLVSPPDLFPVVAGDLALGKPALEADNSALTIRLPAENRGASALDPASITATLTDAKGVEHVAALNGTVLDAGSRGELVVVIEPEGVARGLADLSIRIGDATPASLDIEIGRSESGQQRLRRIGWTALGVAAVILIVLAAGFVSSEDCVSGGNLPGECDDRPN